METLTNFQEGNRKTQWKTLRKEMETLFSKTHRKEIEKILENYQKGNGNPHKRSERKSKQEMKTLRKEIIGNPHKLSERKKT